MSKETTITTTPKEFSARPAPIYYAAAMGATVKIVHDRYKPHKYFELRAVGNGIKADNPEATGILFNPEGEK